MALRQEMTNAGKDVEKRVLGTLVHCQWEYKSVQPLWKLLWRVLRKLKIELSYNSAILLLGIYLKKKKTLT